MKDEKAVVFTAAGEVFEVWDYQGPFLSYLAGEGMLNESFPAPPAIGIWVFDGAATTDNISGYPETELDGIYRPLNQEEQRAIVDGEYLWMGEFSQHGDTRHDSEHRQEITISQEPSDQTAPSHLSPLAQSLEDLCRDEENPTATALQFLSAICERQFSAEDLAACKELARKFVEEVGTFQMASAEVSMCLVGLSLIADEEEEEDDEL